MKKPIYKAGLYFSLASALSFFAFSNVAFADDEVSTSGAIEQVEVDNDDNRVEVDDNNADTDDVDTEWDYGDTDSDDIDTDTDTDD